MSRIYRAGYMLDMLLAVLIMDARWLRTMSYVTARDNVRGERWARCGCWFLGHTVEPDHCARTLSAGDTSRGAMARAGTLFVLGGLALAGIAHALLSLAFMAMRILF